MSTDSTASCERCVTGSKCRSARVIAKKLDAIGIRRRRIHSRMPPRREKLPALRLRDRLVPKLEEPRGGVVPGHAIACAQRASALRDLLARWVLHKPAQRRDDRHRFDRGVRAPQREHRWCTAPATRVPISYGIVSRSGTRGRALHRATPRAPRATAARDPPSARRRRRSSARPRRATPMRMRARRPSHPRPSWNGGPRGARRVRESARCVPRARGCRRGVRWS